MKVFGQLEKAQLENLTADPTGTGLVAGIIWYRTDQKLFKVYDGTTVQTFVDLSTAQTLSNKILASPELTGAVTFNQTTTPTTPSAGKNKFYYKADGQLYTLDSSGNEALVGSGGGATNLITNGSADSVSASIFVPYADTGTRPVDGTGGSPTVTTSVTSTAPLTGTKSFILSKTAVNSQGQGWAIPFTVDPSYRAKSLKISVDYIVNSGTFAAGNNSTPSDGDVIWYLYDITNSLLIEPSNIKMFSSSTTISDSFQATFQTSVTGTSYRLIAHVASTSALAFDLKVDNVTMSPQVYVYGTPETDESSYTPTLSSSTNVTITKSVYKKLGDKLRVTGFLTWTGTGTGGTFTVAVPTGLTIDTAKLNGNGTTLVGAAQWQDSGVDNKTAFVNYNSTNTVAFFKEAVGQLNGTSFTVNDTLSYWFEVPILGWSSSVQMSDSADTRVIQAKYRFTSKNASATLPFNFDTLVTDTHAAVTPSATVWKFTAPSSGKYFVGVQHSSAGNTVTSYLYKNGVQIEPIFTGAFTLNNGSMNGSTEIDLNIGDYIDVRLDNTISGVAAGYVNIFKIQGPQALAASESVNCRYTNTAGTSITNSGTDIVVPFATKDYDSHGAFVTDTFTAPIAGKYDVTATIAFASSLYAAGNQFFASVYKNGSIHSYGIFETIMAALTINVGAVVSTTVNCVAGDTLVVRVFNNRTTGATALLTTAGANHLEIKRVGN